MTQGVCNNIASLARAGSGLAAAGVVLYYSTLSPYQHFIPEIGVPAWLLVALPGLIASLLGHPYLGAGYAAVLYAAASISGMAPGYLPLVAGVILAAFLEATWARCVYKEPVAARRIECGGSCPLVWLLYESIGLGLVAISALTIPWLLGITREALAGLASTLPEHAAEAVVMMADSRLVAVATALLILVGIYFLASHIYSASLVVGVRGRKAARIISRQYVERELDAIRRGRSWHQWVYKSAGFWIAGLLMYEVIASSVWTLARGSLSLAGLIVVTLALTIILSLLARRLLSRALLGGSARSMLALTGLLTILFTLATLDRAGPRWLAELFRAVMSGSAPPPEPGGAGGLGFLEELMRGVEWALRALLG